MSDSSQMKYGQFCYNCAPTFVFIPIRSKSSELNTECYVECVQSRGVFRTREYTFFLV